MRKIPQRMLNADTLLRCALVASLAVYLQTVRFAFVYDDFGAIVMNPWLASWRGLGQIFAHDSWAFSDMPMPERHYRPVFLVWLWAVQHLSAASPGWYHLALLLTHLAAVVLAYRLARELLQDRLGAAIAVVLFALHPTKAEAVGWISAGSDPLMALLFFAALLAYLRWRRGGRYGMAWLAASFLCALAAPLSKETAVVLPGVILAYEWYLGGPVEGGKGSSGAAPWRRLGQIAARVSPFVLADALWWAMRHAALGGTGQNLLPASPKETLLTAPLALCLYLRQLVWPVRLSALYPETRVEHFSAMRVALPLAILLLLGAGLAAWVHSMTLHRMALQGRRTADSAARRVLPAQAAVVKFAVAWFLLTLAPLLSGFSWIQLHDRHLYLPSFAAALVAAVAVRQMHWRWPQVGEKAFGEKAPGEAAQAAAVLALALVLGAISWAETRVWDSDLTVFTRAVAVAPQNIEAVTMLAQAEGDAGNSELALQTLQQGLARQPDSARLLFTLGNQYYAAGNYDAARPLLEKVIHMPASADYHSCALYDLAMDALRRKDYAEAKRLLRLAVRVAPKMTGYQRLLAGLEREHP